MRSNLSNYWIKMLSFTVDGMELGVCVGILALRWVFISFFGYLFWWRFLKDTVLDAKHILSKALIVVALAVFLTLVILAFFFSTVQHTLEITYEYPLGFIYRFY